MADFFKSKKFKILIAIVAVLFGMMLYSASSDGVSNIPRNLLTMITTPFQKGTAYVADATGKFFDKFLNASNISKENERLKKELSELNHQLVDYEKMKDENEQLKKVAKIKESHPDMETTTAFVISRDPSDRYSSFIIDKGALQGVAVNDPVITSNGLIGIVTEVSQINARVQTILSPEIDISAYEIGTKELGVISGEIKLAKEGKCKLSILSEQTEIKKGYMIVTAGSSGKFPKGLPIGRVEEVSTESHGFTKYATITPIEPIEKVVTVQVVTKFLGQGSDLLDYIK
ncbi:rod shape-determining protein MreC [Paludicola sp. MB14-C6]|uniref:rod shape-determining protein MreC n=1 Tax=Paludihabitans sp. MB14-C6 TaxID=3070656 RepID=UPI0027DC9124|nr:rod shape-determining protein MreC [Paludicola sp. MB14-C6]WMJ21864.1 rod shape-determining protein MreC [Paludicola sp. MB14-C6]